MSLDEEVLQLIPFVSPLNVDLLLRLQIGRNEVFDEIVVLWTVSADVFFPQDVFVQLVGFNLHSVLLQELLSGLPLLIQTVVFFTHERKFRLGVALVIKVSEMPLSSFLLDLQLQVSLIHLP